MSREPIPAAAVASVAEMEITLVIEAAEHDPPAAGNERRLLAVIGSGLERLGVQPKHWREPCVADPLPIEGCAGPSRADRMAHGPGSA